MKKRTYYVKKVSQYDAILHFDEKENKKLAESTRSVWNQKQ
jgi:hypothetical protein